MLQRFKWLILAITALSGVTGFTTAHANSATPGVQASSEIELILNKLETAEETSISELTTNPTSDSEPTPEPAPTAEPLSTPASEATAAVCDTSEVTRLEAENAFLRDTVRTLQEQVIAAAKVAQLANLSPQEKRIRELADQRVASLGGVNTGNSYYLTPDYTVTKTEQGDYLIEWPEFGLETPEFKIDFGGLSNLIKADGDLVSQTIFNAEVRLGGPITVTRPIDGQVMFIATMAENLFYDTWDMNHKTSIKASGGIKNITLLMGGKLPVGSIAEFNTDFTTAIADNSDNNWESVGDFLLNSFNLNIAGQEINIGSVTGKASIAGTAFAELIETFASLKNTAPSEPEDIMKVFDVMMNKMNHYQYDVAVNNLSVAAINPNDQSKIPMGSLKKVTFGNNIRATTASAPNFIGSTFGIQGLKLMPNMVPSPIVPTDLAFEINVTEFPQDLFAPVLKLISSEDTLGLNQYMTKEFPALLRNSSTRFNLKGHVAEKGKAEIRWDSAGQVKQASPVGAVGKLKISISGMEHIKAAVDQITPEAEKKKAAAFYVVLSLLGQKQTIDGQAFDVFDLEFDDDYRYKLNGTDITAVVEAANTRPKIATEAQEEATDTNGSTETPEPSNTSEPSEASVPSTAAESYEVVTTPETTAAPEASESLPTPQPAEPIPEEAAVIQ